MLSDKRRTKRFASRIGMVFTDSQGLNFSFVTNISRYGVYLETEKILKPGEIIHFVLSNTVTKVPVKGKVVRVKNGALEGPPSGLGVEFLEMDEMAKIIRDDILLYLMNFEYQNVWAGPTQKAA